MKKLSNKWTRAAIPALLLHASIGTVYCWSIFSYSFKDLGYNMDLLGWAFSLAIFFLGMSAAFLGNFVEKDIHKASFIATVCFAVGVVGTGLAVRLNSAWLVLLFYGVIMGFGLGLGYLSPVKTLMLWFEDKKGLATGLAVAGFGAAKMIFSPVIEWLINLVGLEFSFYILGALWFVMMFVGHLLLRKPEGWVEPHEPFKLKEFISRFKIFLDVKFIGIWLIFYINIACGLALISYEKNIYSALGLGSVATILCTITGLLNAGGRLGYSAIGDKLKSRNTVYKIILISEIAFTVLALCTGALNGGNTLALVVAVALLLVVNAGYGGGFSNLPTLLSDVYGMGSISSIHGIALSAWAIAGLTGNQIAGLIVGDSGNYQNVLIFTVIMYAVAALISFFFIKPKKEQN
ncbi:MAG: MFS transporter [Clostridia bacterium]|nr:MFS transporter [Clostridia bacterium]